MDAWSSLLSELKTETIQPDETLPIRPEPEPEPEPEAEVQPDIVEATYELGISLEAFAASLHAAEPPAPQDDEPPMELAVFEVGMSVAELEASLELERERTRGVDEEVGYVARGVRGVVEAAEGVMTADLAGGGSRFAARVARAPQPRPPPAGRRRLAAAGRRGAAARRPARRASFPRTLPFVGVHAPDQAGAARARAVARRTSSRPRARLRAGRCSRPASSSGCSASIADSGPPRGRRDRRRVRARHRAARDGGDRPPGAAGPVRRDRRGAARRHGRREPQPPPAACASCAAATTGAARAEGSRHRAPVARADVGLPVGVVDRYPDRRAVAPPARC